MHIMYMYLYNNTAVGQNDDIHTSSCIIHEIMRPICHLTLTIAKLQESPLKE